MMGAILFAFLLVVGAKLSVWSAIGFTVLAAILFGD